MTEPNLPLYRATAAWLRNRPETAPAWNQRDFYEITPSCGTNCCVAGFVATLDGETPVIGVIDESGRKYATSVELPNGTVRDIDDYAAQKLGGDRAALFRIFYNVSETDPKWMIHLLSEAAGEEL